MDDKRRARLAYRLSIDAAEKKEPTPFDQGIFEHYTAIYRRLTAKKESP